MNQPSNQPDFSVVTAVFNRAETINRTIKSVLSQTHKNVEYIVVDGLSDDGTSEIVDGHADRIHTIIRGKDNGIYDALNKGIEAATGKYVGFLHADDHFTGNQVLAKIAAKFASQDLDAVYADLDYFSARKNRTTRSWIAREYDVAKFRWGWMPPHPTVYIKRGIYNDHGGYRCDLGTAGDYECMVRMMVKHQISVGYIPEVTINMQIGGESNASLMNRLAANEQSYRAWIVNGLKPPFGLRFSKPLSKLPQYLFPANRKIESDA